ncbi:putative transcriptional regulator [Kushneria sinocarnis]|uniref:UPF0301 protein C7446_0169 n=1 Tax=Kushneria sinocarnis TaxID=595502 RepID=A0A420X0T1_9GAMM|nr:YqgE/AlgH family protein [Kushneria sinocarnis]RKR07357.1 putative transcriptional regulator [Kushneria sinocarnis]
MQTLRDHFLMAMPHLEDENFAGTLNYICDHDETGTLGLVVNRPLSLTLEGLFEQLDIEIGDCPHLEMPVLYGGPVHRDRGFILHRGSAEEWDSSLQVCESRALTTSMDILHELAAGRGPDEFLVCLGCAGWQPDQLAEEIKENTWLNVAATDEILFRTPPETRLEAAANRLGVDLALLSRHAGHG